MNQSYNQMGPYPKIAKENMKLNKKDQLLHSVQGKQIM